MREGTVEEREGLYEYIKSISIKTGINFFDFIYLYWHNNCLKWQLLCHFLVIKTINAL